MAQSCFTRGWIVVVLLVLCALVSVESGIEFDEAAWTRSTWDEFKFSRPRSTWQIVDSAGVSHHAQTLFNLGYEFLSVSGPISKSPTFRHLDKPSQVAEWLKGVSGDVAARDAFLSPICESLVGNVWSLLINAVLNKIEMNQPTILLHFSDSCEEVQDSILSEHMLKEILSTSDEPLGYSLVGRDKGTKPTFQERDAVYQACNELLRVKKEGMSKVIAGSISVYQGVVRSFQIEYEKKMEETSSSEKCEDHHEKCEMWADSGECQANPRYMLANCRLSCGICKGTNGHERLGKFWFLPEQVKNLTSSDLEGRRKAVRNACHDLRGDTILHLEMGEVQIIKHKAPAATKGGTKVQHHIDSFLSGTCAYVNQGWWTYEICFSSQIRQLHFDSHGAIDMEHSLGKVQAASFSHEFTSKEINDMGMRGLGRPYVLEEFTGGADCDKGDRRVPRKSTLRITCGLELQEGVGRTRAHLVLMEPATCEYVFTLFLADMCELLPPMEKHQEKEL